MLEAGDVGLGSAGDTDAPTQHRDTGVAGTAVTTITDSAAQNSNVNDHSEIINTAMNNILIMVRAEYQETRVITCPYYVYSARTADINRYCGII